MDLFGAGLPEHFDDPSTGGSSDNGVIYHDDPFALEDRADGIQLDAHLVHAGLLPRVDEGTANILVLDETNAIGYSRHAGISDGSI